MVLHVVPFVALWDPRLWGHRHGRGASSDRPRRRGPAGPVADQPGVDPGAPACVSSSAYLRLIDRGDFRGYTLYAIGEILLVIIGILIALEVNNWSQNQANEKTELKALTDLREEFEVTKERILTKNNLRISFGDRRD